MEGGEIFLIIFLGLLVLAGILLTIYFVTRHDNNKNNPIKTPKPPTGTSLTPLVPASSGESPQKNQNFSFSTKINPNFKASVAQVISRRSAFAYNINRLTIDNACDAYIWQYKDVTRNNTTIPNAIEFQHNAPGKGILFPTDETISITVGGQAQMANKIKIDDNDITAEEIVDASWIFKDSKICLQNKPNMCLFVVDSEVTGDLATMFLADSTNSTDAGFSWVIGPPPTPSNGCSV
jgi:hypothetical protein